MIASSPPTLPSSQAAAAGPQRVPDPEAVESCSAGSRSPRGSGRHDLRRLVVSCWRDL